MRSNQILPVILCGGSGTRLWPLSRSSYPKQFLSLNENNKNTFIQETFERLNGISQLMNPLIICNEEHRFIVGEQMREKNIEPKSILLEPFGRNTAPAIALAALSALKNEEDPNLLVLSADHFIQNKDKFQELIKIGLKYSAQGKIMTFGVPPTRPETGYGYIETERQFKSQSVRAMQIRRFVEKPSDYEAKKMILNGNYLWNSGIFLGKSSVIIEEIKKFCPDIYKACVETLNSSRKDLNFIRLGEDPFLKCPNISFDIAVMEKTDLGFVIPMEVGWSDVGTWNSLWMESSKDDSGNVKSGSVILDKSENNLLISNNRLIVGLGITDLIVVETNDALLVANRRNDQDVKTMVSLLKDKNLSDLV